MTDVNTAVANIIDCFNEQNLNELSVKVPTRAEAVRIANLLRGIPLTCTIQDQDTFYLLTVTAQPKEA